MNKDSALYNLGRAEGAVRVMGSMIHDSLLSGYSDKALLDFDREVGNTLATLDDVYNYVVLRGDDRPESLKTYVLGRKEDYHDGE